MMRISVMSVVASSQNGAKWNRVFIEGMSDTDLLDRACKDAGSE